MWSHTFISELPHHLLLQVLPPLTGSPGGRPGSWGPTRVFLQRQPFHFFNISGGHVCVPHGCSAPQPSWNAFCGLLQEAALLRTAPSSKLCTLPLHVLYPTLASGARCTLGWAKHHSSDCARTKLRVWQVGAALSLRPAQAMSFQCCISFLSLLFFLEHECLPVC